MQIINHVLSIIGAIIALVHAVKGEYSRAAYFMALAAWIKP